MHNDHIIRAIEMIEGGLGKLLLDPRMLPNDSVSRTIRGTSANIAEYQDLPDRFCHRARFAAEERPTR